MRAFYRLSGGIASPPFRIVGIGLALLMACAAWLSLKAAPPKKLPFKAPEVLKGSFTYNEFDKGRNKNFDWDREDQVTLDNIECRLATVPTPALAQYLITKITWAAKGKGWEVSLSNQGCTYKADENSEGSGVETASLPMSIPGGLNWYPDNNRFELKFNTNSEKGHWKKVYNPCHGGDTQVAEVTKSWEIFIEGTVGYNPKTKDYEFVAVGRYPKSAVPEEGSNVWIQALGDLTGSVR